LPTSSTSIRVLLFSFLKEKIGASEIEIDADKVNTVADIMVILEKRHEEIGKMRSCIRFALNHQYCAETAMVHPGDEVALITPVSGG